ncbi:isoleucine--tRNA ligase [Falsigemmobacter faecalis]|uniref:Isoleucine--tRNA ligase n=1 Tax=Falsigemmobacter faecalis TaxID=2488730 RepID=A0A3P3DVB5_9RHOB|nr:isoleucine--tRNA ligase [Falsigemmobacter faecalis]RRH77392.1 isoleucine--tRNA ligase [Falsigemmobacter faecalis]
MCADTPDYRSTVYLPETDFPMRAGLPAREPAWLDRWESLGIYDRLREQAAEAAANGAPRKPYVLHDGPPYANGNLHIGHALNKTIKDMVVRSHQMMGFDSRYVPGWDCHGLPIEWKIEEQYRAKGLNKDDVDVVSFRQECRKFAEGWVAVQREEFKRLGITGNWANPYLTMDFHAESVIAQEFMKFLMNGTLYQGSKPVMWSPVEKTALAEAEVEYHDHTSHTIWVRFPVASAAHFPELDGCMNTALLQAAVVIWTTTPWTIPQNRAVAYGERIAYGLYRVDTVEEKSTAVAGELLVLADGLAESVKTAAKVAEWTRVRDVAASEFEGMILKHPYNGVEGGNGEWDYDVPMLPGDHVTDDAGTGFVHTAPSHGDDDYQLGVKYKLPMTYNVTEDSSYRKDLPLFGGQHVFDTNGKEGPANVSNIKQLAYSGALLAKGRVKHSYPHSWRSKAPVIFRNTPQWFAAIDAKINDGMGTYGDTIRERALKSVSELVTFTPATGRNRLHAMIEQRPDWVLSRQRAWGVPLTCFTKKDTLPTDADFLLRNDEVNARIAAAFEADGADVWYTEGFKEKVLAGIVTPEDYNQVFDVLDVWFDSGSTHAFVLRDREDGVPDQIADVYLEGTDQHRGWFHSSLLQGSATIGRAPYKNVITHGFTLDEKGMKMSKSLGNTVAPQEVIKEYGADILRLWVAQADYSTDLRIGKEILKGTADSYRRLRNTLRFLMGALPAWDGTHVAREEMPELEQFILHRLAELDAQVRRDYAAFDFQAVFQAIFTFATSDLSAFYFDIRKDALYCDAPDSLERRACLSVMDHAYHALVTWLAPILPFTMEEVWLTRFPGEENSVHLLDFVQVEAGWLNAGLAARFAKTRAARRVVTGALEVERTAKTIGSSLEAAPTVFVSPELASVLGSAQGFDTLCITSGLKISTEAAPEGAFGLDDVAGVKVVFEKAEGGKCQRCWKILPDVGSHAHPATCARCDATLSAAGL